MRPGIASRGSRVVVHIAQAIAIHVPTSARHGSCVDVMRPEDALLVTMSGHRRTRTRSSSEAHRRALATCVRRSRASRHAYCGLIVNLATAHDDGMSLLRALGDEHITVPIVLITSDVPDSVRELPNVRQIKLVLAKPIEIPLLASICLGLCGMET